MADQLINSLRIWTSCWTSSHWL